MHKSLEHNISQSTELPPQHWWYSLHYWWYSPQFWTSSTEHPPQYWTFSTKLNILPSTEHPPKDGTSSPKNWDPSTALYRRPSRWLSNLSGGGLVKNKILVLILFQAYNLIKDFYIKTTKLLFSFLNKTRMLNFIDTSSLEIGW